MKVINCILDILKKVEYVALICILSLIVLTTFLQVVGRYTPLPFSGSFEEIATFSFVWATMIGAGACVSEGGHMSMDLVVSFLPKNKKVFAALFSDFVAIAVGFGVIRAALVLLPKVKRAGMVSGSLQLPLWLQELSLPIGAGLICLWATVNVVKDILEIQKSHGKKKLVEEESEGKK